MESHPRINITNSQLSEGKIILGSFPTWALTPPDKDKKETTEEKELQRIKNNDLNYFYGSSNNHFWNWYSEFVDTTISKENVESIQKSLIQNKIGITDVIFQCTRKNRSSLDKHLTDRIYNHSFFRYPEKEERIKILCTSKGVMNDMLLNKHFYKEHSNLKPDEIKSNIFQTEVLLRIQGNSDSIKNPFYKTIKCESGGIIECFAIPSPGSPFRRLGDFGMGNQDLKKYLFAYLEEVFIWFKS